MVRLEQKYHEAIVPAMMTDFAYRNRFQVPRLRNVSINVCIGEAVQNAKLLDAAVAELGAIGGQRPVVTRARKDISNFKLRRGNPIGCMVTLRRARMYEFLDRLIQVALPQVRDFKGVSDRAFDGCGNYSLGIREQIIFPEVRAESVERLHGLTVSIVTTARTDQEGRALLKHLGMPFVTDGGTTSG
ncbi:MAG: 50S ribosomal protein L5 [Deltaproteobacteria bacterium]|nr:50S ribosomal protein L5 [Deltaproteobacteria bacterium]